ncbi:MAG TPA: hypothetical protein VJ672_02845 [Gemmatimonadaceae bacterium]|nr:hypothetical protein [Gemmatimonadaceae bacterium]
MTKGTNSAPFSAPTVVILGTDLLLTARPATPVQLAHACLAAGYSAALPVSWGDELLASALATRTAARGGDPVIACACPHVADRFSGELDRFLVSVASPPVAAARYVRELYGGPVHITYVGACPGAHDPSIDALYTPGEFLARLRELGIEAEDQPVVFESVIPPDRRRFDSLPGGIPTSDALRRAGASHALLELDGEDYIISLAQRLFEREAVLIDVAPRLGCACAGAVSAGSLRAAVASLEPPRARTPVIETSFSIAIDAPARPARVPLSPPPPPPPPPPFIPVPEPAVAASAPTDVPTAADSPDESVTTEKEEPVIEPPRVPVIPHADLPDERGHRRSPAMGVPRIGSGTPVSRTQQGRVVPRAYLRRRRPWGDADRSHASSTQPPESDEPLSATEPAAPLADMTVERQAADADRQAFITRHVEPAADQSTKPPTETQEAEAGRAPAREPREARDVREVEVPISRIGLPKMAPCDLIPPPPIMPDLHLGDSLVVADSLSDLIGFEIPSRAAAKRADLPEIQEPALYAPSPIAPSTPTAPSNLAPTAPAVEAATVEPPALPNEREALAAAATALPEAPAPPPAVPAVPAEPAPSTARRDAPYSTPRAIEDLLIPRPPRTTPSKQHLPPAVSTPPRREVPSATPDAPMTPPVTPAAAAAAVAPPKATERPTPIPRTVRDRKPVTLPPRRRATAAMIWILVGTLIALAVLSVRLLVTDRMATASPRADSARVAVSDSAFTPMMAPILVDSFPVADSTRTPASVTPSRPDSSRALSAPARRVPGRVRPPTGVRPPVAGAPRRTPTTRPRRARRRAPAATPPAQQQPPDSQAPTPPRSDSTSSTSPPPTDSGGFNQPRVTRPWPPPTF